MLVDLDRWLAAEQEHIADGRVFAHDIFISHRRYDLPMTMVEALSAHGANVIWDCDLDLCDRRVMQGVSRAMRRSRFISLYVSDRFIDSPWCRAEYLNARWVEDSYNISRLLVICESNAALNLIPQALQGCAIFNLSQACERELAALVVSGNSIGDHAANGLLRRVPSERLAYNVSLLSSDEQLNILEQRALFWLEQGPPKINLAEKERASRQLTQLMGDPITESEIIFREVCSLVFESRVSACRRSGITQNELVRVVNMARAVLEGYLRSAGRELRGLDKWAYDFILKPLLLAVELKDTRREAVPIYRTLCSALLCGEHAHEVAIYLRVLEAVEEGQNVASAISNHRLALYDAAQHQRK